KKDCIVSISSHIFRIKTKRIESSLSMAVTILPYACYSTFSLATVLSSNSTCFRYISHYSLENFDSIFRKSMSDQCVHHPLLIVIHKSYINVMSSPLENFLIQTFPHHNQV